MSHFTTHHYFGQQVLKDASPQIVRTIEMNLSAFCWGLQGADLLYAHRNVNEYSELPNYGRMIHGEKTNTLFTFLAHDLLSHRKCLDFDTLLAYYYGFCCHYALDCKLHPYVFSLQKRVENVAGKARGVHWHIEDGIDKEITANMLVLLRKIITWRIRMFVVPLVACIVVFFGMFMAFALRQVLWKNVLLMVFGVPI